MQTVLIVVHLVIVLALAVSVLLQRSEGGLGLGGGGGTSGFMTGRGQANALTRTTAILAALFFASSLMLGVMAHQNRGPRSILQPATPSAQPALPSPNGVQAPAPSSGQGILDELKRLQGDQPAPPANPDTSAPQVPQSR
jgi:preprotein translocase subunit SecG